MRRRPIDPNHTEKRNALRVIGPVVLGIGVLFMIVGFVDFFRAFGGGDPPRLFWCYFVGMPLMFVGLVMTGAGFAGAVVRYHAGEYAPVATDTFNYLAGGTRDGVRTLASAIGEGLRGEDGNTGDAEPVCPDCGAVNETGSNFCDQCGGALPREAVCPGCGEANDADARFCDRCGKPISAV